MAKKETPPEEMLPTTNGVKLNQYTWAALKWHPHGYWYYSVPSSMRRNCRVKVTNKQYNKMKELYVEKG